MWLKIFLLALYLILLFVLSRVLETASWYHDTGSLLTSFAVLDPITLSVKKLKQLLDDRGISYAGVVEKQELVELVKSSGSPSTEDITETADETASESTQFTCGSHFYEEVEDTKDSAWLVHVIEDDADVPLVSDQMWKEVKKKVATFGVRTGVFKCSLDRRLCNRKNWTSSRLILALPRFRKAKEDVVHHTFLPPANPATIFQWVRKQLALGVRDIQTASELEQWLTYPESSSKTELRVILFTLLKSCPMFLSALAIKFNGRVKFGVVDTSLVTSYKQIANTPDQPVYLVVTPEKTIVYGKRRGESFNFKSMELFLRTYVPEMNDVFMLSLLLVNTLAAFELFFIHDHVWKQVLLYGMCVVKYNSSLFLLWLAIWASYQFPFVQNCTDFAFVPLRYISGSHLASMLRCDYKSFYSFPFLLGTFVLFASIAGYVLKKYKWLQREESFGFSWYVPEDTFISTYFFRPMATLTRPVAPHEHDLEVGIELLIERLAVPNLWLQPVISMDYIKDLPVWKYRGWCDADDAMEDYKTDNIYSSDDETTSLIPLKTPNNYKNLAHQSIPDSAITSPQANQTKDSPKPKQDKKPDEIAKTATASLSDGVFLSRSTNPRQEHSDKTREGRAPKGMLEFRECSICLENYLYFEVLCGLPCGHNFHINCIMPWLYRDNHCCPICRWPSYKNKNSLPHLHSQ